MSAAELIRDMRQTIEFRVIVAKKMVSTPKKLSIDIRWGGRPQHVSMVIMTVPIIEFLVIR
jgi:hypothetical protein